MVVLSVALVGSTAESNSSSVAILSLSIDHTYCDHAQFHVITRGGAAGAQDVIIFMQSFIISFQIVCSYMYIYRYV